MDDIEGLQLTKDRRIHIMIIKSMQQAFPIMLISALSLTVAVYAQGSHSKGSSSKAGMEEDVVRVTVEGIHVILDQGSGTKGSRHKESHFSALKVTKAIDEDGRELTDVEGWTLTLDTSKSRNLVRVGKGGKLLVKGTLNLQERVLEVESFKEPDMPGSGSKGSGAKRQGSGSK
ncbi:MAG: hypothetical protein HY314_04520 [Acidobacteria bacterium]|nr:hypothetical protein [Acidobacteriota bacterium]